MTKNDNALLKHQRQEIDRLDNAIIDLLVQRFKVVHQVTHIKKQHNLPAHLPDRIQEVIDLCVANGTKQGLDEDLIRVIWTKIIDTAIAEENKVLKS